MKAIFLFLALFASSAKADTISNLVMTVNSPSSLTLNFHLDYTPGSTIVLDMGLTTSYGCSYSNIVGLPTVVNLGGGNYSLPNIAVPGLGQGACGIFVGGALIHYALSYQNDIGDPVQSADQTFSYNQIYFSSMAIVTKVQTYVTNNSGAAYVTINAGAPIAPISAVNLRTSDNSFVAAGGGQVVYLPPSLNAVTSATVSMVIQNNAFKVNVYALPTASTFTANIMYWANPTNTPTMTSTISPTHTDTSTITATFTRTETPTSTKTVTPSITLTATRTATMTPIISPSITRTITPGVTRSNTRTATMTRTVTPTRTISPTSTATPTRTATPTATPTASPTVTPTFTETMV